MGNQTYQKYKIEQIRETEIFIFLFHAKGLKNKTDFLVFLFVKVCILTKMLSWKTHLIQEILRKNQEFKLQI